MYSTQLIANILIFSENPNKMRIYVSNTHLQISDGPIIMSVISRFWQDKPPLFDPIIPSR